MWLGPFVTKDQALDLAEGMAQALPDAPSPSNWWWTTATRPEVFARKAKASPPR